MRPIAVPPAGTHRTSEHGRDKKENRKLANWPELEAERAGAGKVKQEKPILVILGNPPYNAYAGISPEEDGTMGVMSMGKIRAPRKNAEPRRSWLKNSARPTPRTACSTTLDTTITAVLAAAFQKNGSLKIAT
ncbi:hypothetical protein B4Q13_25150 [Lacticaseibacillus rhamnosus]